MSTEPCHVLVAVDDPAIRPLLLDSLTAMGFSFEEGSAKELTSAALEFDFDLVILNLGLPDPRGIETCRRLRALYPDLGIIMMQADGTAADEVAALDAGADDCIAAPFRFRELVARLRAVLQHSPAVPLPRSVLLRAGDLEMDPVHRLFRKSSQEVHLSPHQFDLLLFLMRHPEMTLTHVKLLRGVWGSTCGRDSGYLRTYIKALRQKIEVDPAKPQYILTEPWVGYRFHNPSGSSLSVQ